MNFKIKLISNRNFHTDQYSFTEIKSEGIKELETILPTKDQIVEFAKDNLLRFQTKQPQELIHILLPYEEFVSLVKRLYKKIGKHITVDEGLLFKIPMKNKKSFFQEVTSIVLYSEELQIDTIIIHT